MPILVIFACSGTRRAESCRETSTACLETCNACLETRQKRQLLKISSRKALMWYILSRAIQTHAAVCSLLCASTANRDTVGPGRSCTTRVLQGSIEPHSSYVTAALVACCHHPEKTTTAPCVPACVCVCVENAERYFGVGDSSEFLTNGEVWTVLDPRKRSSPYVYDKFETWGKCSEWHFDV